MKRIAARYAATAVAALAFVGFIVAMPDYEAKAVSTLAFQLKTMLLFIPPVFILLGLMDIWVPREKMIKHLGEASAVKGGILAFLLGSFAAGPLYGAFPFAAVLMKKGASLRNVLIFLGSWSATKIPMLIFQWASLGPRFTLSMLAIDIIGILVIAWTMLRLLSKEDIERMYRGASELA